MAAHLIRRGFLAILAAGLLAACMTAPQQASRAETAADPAPVTRLFLVRHAEKEAGPDPALTPAGEARAAALAERLAAEGVTEIWSTDTRRTQGTARPLAAARELAVQSYDPRALPAFANQLAETPGIKLVVGHSNTTDALAALIGADPGPPIDDAAEFDRLYVIMITDGYQVSSRIERYGQPSPLGTETSP
jgi:2,3-bisphosphoglycerate-dependent phosphoglycerate mutase